MSILDEFDDFDPPFLARPRRKYASREEAKQARKLYLQKWRADNSEKIRAHKRKAYAKAHPDSPTVLLRGAMLDLVSVVSFLKGSMQRLEKGWDVLHDPEKYKVLDAWLESAEKKIKGVGASE